MSAFGGVSVFILAIRVIVYLMNRSGGRRVQPTNVRWRVLVWGVVVALWGLGGLTIVLPAWIMLAVDQISAPAIQIPITIVLTLAFAAAGVLLFAPWTILRALARRGRPRLVCYLGHASFVFFTTGETASAATLLAALALAHRGQVTPWDRAWLETRLRRERHFLGTFATARAYASALEARALRDLGRPAEALEWEHAARVLLGTVTYLSKHGVPKPVRSLAYEYLALDAARTGQWGGVHVPPDVAPTAVHKALNDWATPRFFEIDPTKKPSGSEAGLRHDARSVALPLRQALDTRPDAPLAITGVTDIQKVLSASAIALWRGAAVSPRKAVHALLSLDLLTDPRSPACVLPVEIREDEAQVDAIHDEIASALARPMTQTFVPFHALPHVGPVSARVHQKVEAALFAEWATACARVDERRAGYLRRRGYDEWLEVSNVRSIYRRIERALGESAAARMWPQFAITYGYLGVRLSEEHPRMRPLAYAVFACMAREAERFGDRANIDMMANNLKVTGGPG